MKRLACLVALVAAAVFTGCATPSVHPIYTQDTLVEDPAVVGTWKEAGSGETYTVTRAGDAYTLVVKDNDKQRPREWKFAVRVTQIGPHRFADFSPAEDERQAHEERWGILFLPTHMFCRYTVGATGGTDTLVLRFLNRDWLRKAMADGTAALGSTTLDRQTTLLTSETPALRAFLEKFGGDDAAFADICRLQRVKP